MYREIFLFRKRLHPICDIVFKNTYVILYKDLLIKGKREGIQINETARKHKPAGIFIISQRYHFIHSAGTGPMGKQRRPGR